MFETMKTIDQRVGNMSVSGPSLRARIYTATGIDPYRDRDFAWSDELPCDDCTVVDSTAVVSIDGEKFERLCDDCLGRRWTPTTRLG